MRKKTFGCCVFCFKCVCVFSCFCSIYSCLLLFPFFGVFVFQGLESLCFLVSSSFA